MGRPPDDNALLAGGPVDFGSFYARHEDAMLTFFLRRTGSAELAADLAAETFARALEGRRRFDPGFGPAQARGRRREAGLGAARGGGEAARPRGWGRARRARTLAVALAIALGLAGVAYAATQLIQTGDPVPPPPHTGSLFDHIVPGTTR